MDKKRLNVSSEAVLPEDASPGGFHGFHGFHALSVVFDGLAYRFFIGLLASK
jgi:hypothetical protein